MSSRAKLAVCRRCGKAFLTPKRLLFCSRDCLRQWRSDALAEYSRTANPLNKRGGVFESRIRSSLRWRGDGEGKAYRKLLGQHAHRVIAAEMIGRPLRPGEVVHHLDGDKLNNFPENLEVLPSQSIHVRQHPRRHGRWCR